VAALGGHGLVLLPVEHRHVCRAAVAETRTLVNEFGEEPDRDVGERAADATEESRRRAAEEGRTLEDQPDPLAVDDDEGEGEVTAY
jgi:hypothetical protein